METGVLAQGNDVADMLVAEDVSAAGNFCQLNVTHIKPWCKKDWMK